jgi:hypothetical protein
MTPNNICLNLNNTIDISNNHYIFNNNNSIIGDYNQSTYGLYETSGNKIYSIQNIPKTHPIGFFDASDSSPIVDISNLIKYDVSYSESIKIYVSKGSDLIFSNDDYYRFYDESYNLLNISGSLIQTGLTNSGDNFYFMRSMEYTFIAIEDFSINHPFALSGDVLKNDSNYNNLILQNLDDSFNIIIPKIADNSNNRIFYVDGLQNDISGQLSILVDASNISYYYGNISLTVDVSFGTDLNENKKLSIKSFPLNGIPEVSNTNIFVYNDSCNYVVEGNSEFQNSLDEKNIECLNIVSEANLKFLDDNPYYEFNLNNHLNNDSSLNSLNYGLYDTTSTYIEFYTIFNIDENYPITISNNDFSNAIYVDEENTTGILNKSNPIIQELQEPFNSYNFYYGTVRIKLDNSGNTFTQNKNIIKIHILDKLENVIHEPSNNFVYTELCNNPDNVNGISSDKNPSFILYNQKGISFENDFTNTANIYYLNLYQTYEEPIIPYTAIDRYNHDISNLVRSTAPNYEISNDLSHFIIKYILEDYEKRIFELSRLVEIRKGPFIEVVGNNDIFYNSNPFTNRIDVLANTFETSLNFFENLDVFMYDNSRNKISLPFEITLSGEFYSPTSPTLSLLQINDNSRNILKYENFNSKQPIEFYINSESTLKYYLSKNFNYKVKIYGKNEIDGTNGFIINNISNIEISNKNSPILSETNLIEINYDSNSLSLDGATIAITGIDNCLNIIYINQKYPASSPLYNLNTSIKITNSEFLISISDINESSNDFYINGSFNPINFFSTEYIDTRRIGNYEIIVDVKGLSNEDFIYNDLTNDLNNNLVLNNLILDFSRTFLVNVENNFEGELNFVNQNQNQNQNQIQNFDSLTSQNDNRNYEYLYSNDLCFNIRYDIDFFNKGKQYLDNTTKPLLEFSSNSIYKVDLSFNLDFCDNIIIDNCNNIAVNDKERDASAIIVYKAIDLFDNSTNHVNLNIKFTNRPLLTLSGSTIKIITVGSPYTEPGILIKGSISGEVIDVSYIPSVESFFDSSSGSNVPGHYDISWDLVLDISNIGRNTFTYTVSKSNDTNNRAVITRVIEVVDNVNPFFRFPDLSHIAYIDGANDPSFVEVKDTLINNKFNNSFNIDFSLTVFSTFDDLSFIINTFEVSDNYFPQNPHTDLTTMITLSISGEGDISFTTTGLRNVLNSDNCFNKVTIGRNKVEPLTFNYNVIDACDNSFNIRRIVNIVDTSVPSIDFSFDYTSNRDLSYALFSSDYKDFSYQAINYLQDSSLLIFELSSIIFNFSLIDNYEIDQSNYVISILGTNHEQKNIKTITDISNDISSLALFSNIDTSLIIVYEISDNQYNDISINRKVNIINTSAPSISFISNNEYDDRIYITFGDTNYNILSNFSLSHSRLLTSDISLDLSYIFPPHITSFSGNFEYDPSALIYSVTGDISTVYYDDISFYSILLQEGYNITSEPININLIINNKGPSFNEIPSIEIEHEAGEFFNDASFILGINAFSEFDKFYYRNYDTSISYLYTNFEISYDSSFDINNPESGTYSILYEAIDKNNQSAVLERFIKVNDSKPPIISLSTDITDNTKPIKQFDELYMPSAFFEDIGSDLSKIIVDLTLIDTNSNSSTKNFTTINFASDPLKRNKIHQLTSSNLLLDSNDTSDASVSYEIKYTAFDIFNNSSEKILKITISESEKFVITPKLSISGNVLDLDLNFNTEFNNLINNNIDNLSSLFNVSDIVYDEVNKTIIYRVRKKQSFNLLHFDMSSSYGNTKIPDNNNTVIINITTLTLGIHKVIFQSFEHENFKSSVEEIDFKIINSSPPELSFILSPDYKDISDINIPLLSLDTYNTLQTNVNYLKNNNLSNPYYFTSDDNGNPMYSIPGIHIYDKLFGKTQSLSNETLPSIYDNSLSLYVSYSELNQQDGEYIDFCRNNLINLIEFKSINEDDISFSRFIQKYQVFDEKSNNISDISRSITVSRFLPFINLNYTQDFNRNIFLKTYHEQFTAFIDPLGRAYDYYLGELTEKTIQIVEGLREDILDIHTLEYQLEDYPNTKATRQVHVVNIECLPKTTNGLNNFIAKGINYKYGLYINKYRINIIDSSNAIRVFGYNYDFSYNIDISNLISISGENVVTYGGYEYYWGEIDLTVNGNFNRANMEYLDMDLNRIILKDIFLYKENCSPILINEIFNKPLPSYSFKVDVSDNTSSFFTLSGELYPDLKNQNNNSGPNLHLPMGKYTFFQDTKNNFYNKIKFSLTKDGTHNGGKEYTKDIKDYGLAGLSGAYTVLILSITTPSPLYYYSEHFPNMGGKIETRNNLLITEGNIYVNDNILTVDNSSVLIDSFSGADNESLKNKIFLSQKFDISLNRQITSTNMQIDTSNLHFNCITQQNINHNIIVNKHKNLIIFKRYENSSSNKNLRHDISNNYLFDFSVNNTKSYIFQYDYTKDTSINLLQNLSINILRENIAVVVGSGIKHTIAFSDNNGVTWNGLGKTVLDISGLGVAYNGTSRFIAVGSGTKNTIVYSDNGENWYPTINSKLIFNYAKAVVYDNFNSYWLVGGEGTTNTLAYSSNGIIWSELGKTVFETRVNGFSKHNGDSEGYILALGNGINNSIASSNDGLNWTGGFSDSGGNTKVIFSVEGNGGVFYKKENIWIVVGEGRVNSIAYSNDGKNWIGLGKTKIDIGNDIDANDSMVIIVGKKYTSGNYSSIIYSYDGIIWNNINNTDIFTECNSIVWTGTVWLATGETTIAKSINGKDWVIVDNTIDIFSENCLGIEGFTKNTRISDPNNTLYETNILDLFYTDEINNYSNFFKKNKLLSNNIIKENFISKINELRYINQISLIDGYEKYDYFLEKYLTSNRIRLSHVFDNFITFNLQTYIDLSNLDINKDLLTILYNQNIPLNNTHTNYRIDNNNLLFQEFIVNIWSDISGNFTNIQPSNEESILLSNGLIELNEYLLDSSYTSDLLYNLYNNESNDVDVNEKLKNNIFLSVRDISMTSDASYQYIGLTMQNIYHNMYIDENNVLIFHKYQDLCNNFQVNEPNLTLEETKNNLSNNKNYLLELSSNDVYGCFADISENIYNNKNSLYDLSKYKSFIKYFFDNELDNNNKYLSNFDIRPISKNDICYNLYPYTYDNSLQTLHSHSYLIDLNDYFDRYMYINNNNSDDVPWNIYNKSNLVYKIVDISFINEFNIFDIEANQNIIIDKNKINNLNYLQNFLIIINFKLDYLYKILHDEIIFNNLLQSYNPNDYLFINNTNLQNITELYNSIDFISTNYQLTLSNTSLNKLFANNFYNTKQLKAKYLRLKNIFTYYHYDDTIELSEYSYDSIRNFDNIEQLSTDASLINLNIDNIIKNNLYYFYDNSYIEHEIFLEPSYSYITIDNYNQFDELRDPFIKFYEIKNSFDNTILELKLRNLVNTNNNYTYVDIYDNYYTSNIYYFTKNLYENFINLYNEVLVEINNSYIELPTIVSEINSLNNDPNISDLSDIMQKTETMNTYYKDTHHAIITNFIKKNKIYDRINYFMSGSKLLINSFYSNNIKIKFDIKYNSYLYPNKYVDTIVLDLAIPDYIPPTLIFNNTDLSFSQALSTNESIDTLLQVLIEDISFIELNQEAYDKSDNLNNIDIIYNDIQSPSYENFQNLRESEQRKYSTIIIDVRNIYNETTNFIGDNAFIDIFYTVIDNANNKNTITRTVNIERAFEYPIFFIDDLPIEEFLQGRNWSLSIQQGTIITNELLIAGLTARIPSSSEIPDIKVEYTLADTNTTGIYEEAIIYKAISNKGVGIITILKRDIIVTEAPQEETEDFNTQFHNCPCPVFYKPIQHNYKLGSSASNAMRLSRIIIRK